MDYQTLTHTHSEYRTLYGEFSYMRQIRPDTVVSRDLSKCAQTVTQIRNIRNVRNVRISEICYRLLSSQYGSDSEGS
jgi:hypothetical protein